MFSKQQYSVGLGRQASHIDNECIVLDATDEPRSLVRKLNFVAFRVREVHGGKNQGQKKSRPFAQMARDKDGITGLLSFTSGTETPAAQDLSGGSTQRAGRSVLRYAR